MSLLVTSKWEQKEHDREGGTLPIVPKWKGCYAPSRHVKMRGTTQGGGGTPLLIALKWKEHDEKGICTPLLVASKRKLEHDREGWCSPHHVEMARTQWRGAYPSSSRQKGNENTTGRTPGSPRRVQVARTWQGGHMPPRRIKKETKTWWGGVMLKW